MAKNAKYYAQLAKVQNVIKTRDESELNHSRRERNALQEEDDFLFQIMQEGKQLDFYNPLLIHQRLQRNARLIAILDDKITKQRQVLRETSKRFEILEERHKNARAFEERKEISAMLEEHITAKIAKDISLA